MTGRAETTRPGARLRVRGSRLLRTAMCAGVLAGVPALGFAKSLDDAERIREQAQHDCFDDVNKLCPNDIPDEDRIIACMKAQRAQLSPICRKEFEQGLLMRKK